MSIAVGNIVTINDSVRPAHLRGKSGPVETIRKSDGEVGVSLGGITTWFRFDELEDTGRVRTIKVSETPEEVPSQTSVIRVWGAENGFDVGNRGRLSPALVDAYRVAHPNEVVSANVAIQAPVRTRANVEPQKPSKAAKIREWGRKHGYQVGARGRLSPDLVAAYGAARAAARAKRLATA